MNKNVIKYAAFYAKMDALELFQARHFVEVPAPPHRLVALYNEQNMKGRKICCRKVRVGVVFLRIE